MSGLNISAFLVVVRHPDGRTEQLQVDSDRVLVGSGAHCEVRLPREHAAVEALLLEAQAGGIFAEARSFDPAPTVNGTPFTSGRLLPDAVVRIGALDVTAQIREVAAQTARTTKKLGSGVVTYVLSGLLLLAGVLLLLRKPEASLLSRPAPAAPPLWTKATAVRCPHSDVTPASTFARERLLRAEGQRERAPFHPADGISAVKEFELAAACFEAAGNGAATEGASAAARSLRRRMSEEFHIHRVRLERALAGKDYDAAQTEVRLLLALLRGRKEDYVSYLANLDRMIQLKFSGKKENRP